MRTVAGQLGCDGNGSCRTNHRQYTFTRTPNGARGNHLGLARLHAAQQRRELCPFGQHPRYQPPSRSPPRSRRLSGGPPATSAYTSPVSSPGKRLLDGLCMRGLRPRALSPFPARDRRSARSPAHTQVPFPAPVSACRRGSVCVAVRRRRVPARVRPRNPCPGRLPYLCPGRFPRDTFPGARGPAARPFPGYASPPPQYARPVSSHLPRPPIAASFPGRGGAGQESSIPKGRRRRS
jgi:hypothetical protein